MVAASVGLASIVMGNSCREKGLVDVLVVHYLKGYVELLREPTSVIEVLE